jgi:hypothetical protein
MIAGQVNHTVSAQESSLLTRSTRRSWVAGAGLFALALYAATCAPGLLWQDSALFQWRVRVGEYSGGSPGLALAHPLYIFLARLFALLPLGEHAYRVNLFSSVCAAGAVAVFADMMLRLTQRRLPALAATILLALSHTFWKHAVIAEVMSLYSLALAIELWLLVRYAEDRRARWLLTALLVNGLNVSNHLLALLHAPAYAGFLFNALRLRRMTLGGLVAGIGCFLLGSAPYWILCLAHVAGGRPLGEVVHSALFGEVFAKDVLNTSVSPMRQSLRTLQYFVMNFPTPLLVLAPIGFMQSWRDPRGRTFAWAVGAIFLVDFVFAFRYSVADQYVFFLPCYVLTALYAGWALAKWELKRPWSRWFVLALCVLPMPAYEVGPALLKQWNVAIPGRQDVPFRDAYAYFLRPRMNGETSARHFAEAALDQAAPDGLLIADFSVNSPIIYVRDLEGRGRDVCLVKPSDLPPRDPSVMLEAASVRPYAERGAAWITTKAETYTPTWMRDQYEFAADGVLYRLVRRAAGNVTPDVGR